jgi:hypothetical protein
MKQAIQEAQNHTIDPPSDAAPELLKQDSDIAFQELHILTRTDSGGFLVVNWQ